jgi:TonB family protein
MLWANVPDGNQRTPTDGRFAQTNNDVAVETVRRMESPRDRSIDGRDRLTSPGREQPRPSQSPGALPPRAAPVRRVATRAATNTATQGAAATTQAATPGASAQQAGAARGTRGARGAPGDGRAPGAPGTSGLLALAGRTLTGGTLPAAGGSNGTQGSQTHTGGGGTNGNQGTGGSNGANGQNGQNGQSRQRAPGTGSGQVTPRIGIEGLGPRRTLLALTPSIETLGAVYGQSELERWRREDEHRRGEARGDYGSNWRQTRAAIENVPSGERLGDATALRTRASPFAAYIEQMHDKIHEQFAENFISRVQSLPGDSPMYNDALHTILEISIDPDGSIHAIRVTQPSGWLPFDVGAINAVRASLPFPATPEVIRSPDTRVYVLWHFRRSGNYCHDIRPFILRGSRSVISVDTPDGGTSNTDASVTSTDASVTSTDASVSDDTH